MRPTIIAFRRGQLLCAIQTAETAERCNTHAFLHAIGPPQVMDSGRLECFQSLSSNLDQRLLDLDPMHCDST
jgi:hypothetical protein